MTIGFNLLAIAIKEKQINELMMTRGMIVLPKEQLSQFQIQKSKMNFLPIE